MCIFLLVYKKHDITLGAICIKAIWIAQEGLMANPASLQSFDPNSDSTADLLERINFEMVGV